MSYRLLYHPLVLKEDLGKIPYEIKFRIKKVIETRLLSDPVLAGKPLRQSLKGHRKLRIGDWRLIYRIQRKDIIILKIGHRREIYRRVKNRKNINEDVDSLTDLRFQEKSASSFDEYLKKKKL